MNFFLVLAAIFNFEVLNNNDLMCVYSLVNMNSERKQLKNISFTIRTTQYYTAEKNHVLLP
jgi:hypothetical protein